MDLLTIPSRRRGGYHRIITGDILPMATTPWLLKDRESLERHLPAFDDVLLERLVSHYTIGPRPWNFLGYERSGDVRVVNTLTPTSRMPSNDNAVQATTLWNPQTWRQSWRNP